MTDEKQKPAIDPIKQRATEIANRMRAYVEGGTPWAIVELEIFCALREGMAMNERDAARYRWLRVNGDLGCTEKDGYGGTCLMYDRDLDAAIDAAMLARNGE